MVTLWIDPQVQKLDDLIGKGYQDLYNDIKDHGIRSPIVASRQDGSITDGHNRFRVCTALGITIPDDKIFYKDYENKEEQILDGIKINILRRDVSAENRDKLIKAYFEIKPNVSTRSASKELQVSRRKAEGLRLQVVQKGQNEPPAKREGKDGKLQSAKKKSSKPVIPYNGHLCDLLNEYSINTQFIVDNRVPDTFQTLILMKLRDIAKEESDRELCKMTMEQEIKSIVRNLKNQRGTGTIGTPVTNKYGDGDAEHYKISFTATKSLSILLREYCDDQISKGVSRSSDDCISGLITSALAQEERKQ